MLVTRHHFPAGAAACPPRRASGSIPTASRAPTRPFGPATGGQGRGTRQQQQQQQQRQRLVSTLAASGSAAATDAGAVGVIKRCVEKPNSVPAPVVLDAMLQLEGQKQLLADDWADVLSAPGTHWRLVFTADDKQVQAAKKKQPNKGGIYFPLTAVQKFDAARKDFENGVFLGPLASLTFNGPYAVKGRQLSFDVVNMNVGLGPWRFSVPLKKGAKPVEERDAQDAKALPFFLYAYVDKDVVVARGRSGGLAVWQRADKEWEARAGVLAVYK